MTPDKQELNKQDMPLNDVYEVVVAYTSAQSAAPDDAGVLQGWLNDYPRFQEELRATAWQVWSQGPHWLTRDEAHNLEEDPDVVQIGHAVLASLLPQETFAAPLTSLLGAAKAKGLTSRDFAHALHLDVPLLARLEQRLIRAASLPRALVAQIAQILDRSLADVTAYLRGGAVLAAGAHYKAQQAPRVGDQIDFASALISSSADTRAFWQDDHDMLGAGKDETR